MSDMGSMVEVDRMVNVSHVVVVAAGMVWMMCKGVMGMTVVSARWRLVVLMRKFGYDTLSAVSEDTDTVLTWWW